MLSRYRAAVGLSQEDLAERAGLSVRGVSDLERGARTRPHATTVHQLAEALHLSAGDRAILEQAARRAKGVGTQVAPSSPVRGSFLGASPPGPLVGREEEMGHIRSALQAVVEGTGQSVLLVGELGTGKTRLAQEVTVQIRELENRSAVPAHFLIGTGRCYQRNHETLYGPLFEALSELTETTPPTVRSTLEPRWEELCREVDAIVSNGTAGIDAQRSLRVTVTGYITALAAVAPIALLFDDLHHADEGTIGLLQHLAHETRGTQLLLVATVRDTNLSEEHPVLAQALRDLARERLAERIIVRRLSAEETADLAASLMGAGPIGDDIAAFLYRRTKGIPRFVEEMVRAFGGRLELQGEIGAGAMGRVFAAYDAQTERQVAAKLMLARWEADLDTLLRFQRDAAVLSKLRHPGIVEIYDSFIDEHASCIVMELLPGRSLGQILEDGPLPLARAKHMAQQVAAALSYAHSQQIIHRDIKPDNVMVLEGDHVKVTDFGIARILQPDTSLQTIATTGMRMGTPLYMAPEQIEGKKIDGRTDVYALGAMLYHMVTGRPPFEGSDALAVAVKHLQEEPVPPSQVNPSVPTDWDILILKAMTKEPAKRFQSAHTMAGAIATLSENPGVPTRKERQAHAVAAMGLVVVAAVALAVAWSRAMAPSPPSLKARLDSYLSGQAAQARLSGTVLVADTHGIVLDRGYGYADQAARIRNGPNTSYADVALTTNLSITEIVARVQAGSLHWGDRVCGYLPRCPPAWKAITVRSLVDGTSRLPDYYWGHPGNSVSQSLAGCQGQPLDPPSLGPVEYQVCTNLVAALLVEKVDGNPWGVDPIFQLAGMQNSGQLSDSIRSPARAVDYVGSAPDPNTTYNDYVVAYTTVEDEYSFDNALFGGRLLSPRYLGAILAPRAPVVPAIPGIAVQRWGYYWESGALFGRPVDFTYSEINHFLSVNMRFPGTGLTVIVLSNSSGTDVRAVAIHAAAIALGHPVPSSPTSRYVARALLGTYQRTFTASEARKGLDPLGFQVGHTETLVIHPAYVHFVLVGDAFTDEYYQATPGGRIALMSYLPANENNMCQVQPNLTPPTGYFRWSLKGRALSITTVNGNHCGDRVAFFSGRWTRTS